MEKIIAQIAENFIKKILENISSRKKLEEIEPVLLKNCKETAVGPMSIKWTRKK